jgi:hypothetical protein
MQTGRQMVVKLSDQGVIRDVRSEARVSDRSMAGQVEHWVKLGRVVEAILGNEEVKVLKENLPFFLKQVSAQSVESKIVSTLTQIMLSPDREAMKAKILAPGVPVYESDPAHTGKVIRIMPDGTRASGRVKDGVFTPSPVHAAR